MVCGIVKKVTNKLIPWTRVILEKLILPQTVEIFSAVYGTPRFNSMFTRAHHFPYPEAEQSASVIS
jgi:hypothetical protein